MKASVVLLAAMLIAVIIAMEHRGQAAVTCGRVDTSLAPCLLYLTTAGGGDKPSPACCSGVQNLKDMTPTTEDRQGACKCIKHAASKYSIKPDKASQLPNACGVDIGVPVTPSIDCSKFT